MNKNALTIIVLDIVLLVTMALSILGFIRLSSYPEQILYIITPWFFIFGFVRGFIYVFKKKSIGWIVLLVSILCFCIVRFLSSLDLMTVEKPNADGSNIPCPPNMHYNLALKACK